MYLREVKTETQECNFCHSIDNKYIFESDEIKGKFICKKCVNKLLPIATSKISDMEIEVIKKLVRQLKLHSQKVRRKFTSLVELKALLTWRLNPAEVQGILGVKQLGIGKKVNIQVTFDDNYILVIDNNKLHFILLLYLGEVSTDSI